MHINVGMKEFSWCLGVCCVCVCVNEEVVHTETPEMQHKLSLVYSVGDDLFRKGKSHRHIWAHVNTETGLALTYVIHWSDVTDRCIKNRLASYAFLP